MPLFAGLFATLFASIASFFATIVTKKVALGAAAVTTFGVLTVAFMGVIGTAISTVLSVSSPPSWFIQGLWLILPGNFVACVSAIIAGYVACAIYQWNVENLRLLAYVT